MVGTYGRDAGVVDVSPPTELCSSVGNRKEIWKFTITTSYAVMGVPSASRDSYTSSDVHWKHDSIACLGGLTLIIN